jgi:cytochrome b
VMQDTNAVRVWDPLVRAFHWSLVGAFAVAWLSEDVLALHTLMGYSVLSLVLVRIGWGFIGTRHARFADFVRCPATVFGYLRAALRLDPPRYLGHNPAGGLMVMVLLGSLLLVTLTGLAAYGAEERAGPLAGWATSAAWKDVHEFFANLTLGLVMIHILGVLVESVLHGENLPRAMLTGYKRARARQDTNSAV